jgi:hypothetical protein
MSAKWGRGEEKWRTQTLCLVQSKLRAGEKGREREQKGRKEGGRITISEMRTLLANLVSQRKERERDEIAFTKRCVALINVACHGFAYP